VGVYDSVGDKSVDDERWGICCVIGRLSWSRMVRMDLRECRDRWKAKSEHPHGNMQDIASGKMRMVESNED
jgi:hypothetical protein